MPFDAEVLINKIISSVHVLEVALELSVWVSHPFYDALFIAAAINEQVQVITFACELAEKFPDQVRLLE